MPQAMIDRDCDMCGSAERKLVTTENGYPISRCLNCGFVYVDQIPEVENGKVIGEYYTGDHDEIQENRKRYEGVSEFLLTEIARYKKPGTLLDVGCGYGFFLVKAREQGWEVFGTDLSDVAVRYAKSQIGSSDMICSDLSDDIFDGRKFDAINLTNVLEHVPSPTRTLESCRALLADDGILTVRVPNIGFGEIKRRSLGILKLLRIGKGGELSYLASSPPTHLSGFSSRTLAKYFEKAGLATVAIKPSKLSGLAQENAIFGVYEIAARSLYKISFHKINLSPTILAIAKRRVIRRSISRS